MTWVRLAELVQESVSGYWGSPPGDADLDALAITNGAVTETSVNWVKAPLRSFTQAQFDKAQIRPEDVLITTSGDCGKVAHMRRGDLEFPAAATNFVRLLRFRDRVDPRYAFHFMCWSGFKSQLQPFIRGTSMQNLSWQSASAAVKVYLPSMGEQCRIAAILDQADAIRSNRRQVLAHLDALPGNLFRSHFPSANFPRRAIGDLGRVSTGKTPPTSAPGMFEGEIPFVTPGDLESDAPVARSVTSQGAAHSRTVEPGATLVCCIGATIGKVGLASARVAFNQQINAVEWGPDVDCAYGYWATRSIRPLIVARGASTTLPLLPKSKFSELRLPVPPLEQQREFATIVDAARQPRDGVLQALAREDELFASLQARAFRGEV